MAMWKERGFIYKSGFCGVLLGSLLFVIGFCTPAWAVFEASWMDSQSQSMGLWQTCLGDLSVCAMSVSNDNFGWLKAVRALECISMFFAVASCISGLYSNCILKADIVPEFFNKNMETSAIVAVVFGCFGLIIFATQFENCFPARVGQISWSFVLVCISNGFMGMSAFLMLISHRLLVLAHQGQFVHRQFHAPYHTQVSDYSIDGHVPSSDGMINMVPPPYESILPLDEDSPPPYSELEKSNMQASHSK